MRLFPIRRLQVADTGASSHGQSLTLKSGVSVGSFCFAICDMNEECHCAEAEEPVSRVAVKDRGDAVVMRPRETQAEAGLHCPVIKHV